ncbi:hypothetical protein [Nocardia beijingensis]|uniref:Uncharacterized protein n=1 Tax=Nocardia beijingensis TaxID=95162 RepID=A0ABW7WEH5_9NOCA
MEIRSALQVIAYRRHFDDLELALRFAGCGLSDEPRAERQPTTPASAETEPPESEFFEAASMANPADGWSLLTEDDVEETIRDTTAKKRLEVTTMGGKGGSPRQLVPIILPSEEGSPPVTGYRHIPLPSPPATQPTARAGEYQHTRAISSMISTILRRDATTNVLDTDKIVEKLALAMPIIDPPLLQRPRTKRPIRVLYDISLSIGPFAGDISDLLMLIYHLLTENEIRFEAFRSSVLHGCGSGPVWSWRPFEPLREECTYVFISGSFGADFVTRAAELDEVASELDRRGHAAHVVWFGEPPAMGKGRSCWRVIRT